MLRPGESPPDLLALCLVARVLPGITDAPVPEQKLNKMKKGRKNNILALLPNENKKSTNE
jgi:hypothetical protein